MKKILLLAQSLFLSVTLCNEPSGPIAQEFKELEKKGATTAELLAAVDGRVEQVAKETDRIRLALDAYQSTGTFDEWTFAHHQLIKIIQLAQAHDNEWINALAELMQRIPVHTNQSSNLKGNMQIMFEAGGRKPSNPPENSIVCAPEKANHITLELELVPTETENKCSPVWAQLVYHLIKLIKKLSNDELVQELAAEAIQELAHMLVDYYTKPETGIRITPSATFYIVSPSPEAVQTA